MIAILNLTSGEGVLSSHGYLDYQRGCGIAHNPLIISLRRQIKLLNLVFLQCRPLDLHGHREVDAQNLTDAIFDLRDI